jgi:hypothetical protein
MAELVTCASCKTEVSADARLCPKCGAFMRSRAAARGPSRVLLFALVLVVAAAAAWLVLGA